MLVTPNVTVKIELNPKEEDDDGDELFCGMVDRGNTFGLISSQDYCQRSSPLRISDTPQAEFEPVQNLSLDFLQ